MTVQWDYLQVDKYYFVIANPFNYLSYAHFSPSDITYIAKTPNILICMFVPFHFVKHIKDTMICILDI